MALVKKSFATVSTTATDDTVIDRSSSTTRDAEVQRKRARTLAKQQQTAERMASTTSQMSSGIAQAASSAEELRRASDQIAAGAEAASGASQLSLTAFKQVEGFVARQLQNADMSRTKGLACQVIIEKTNTEVALIVSNVSVAADRQNASVTMVAELEKQAANIGDIIKAVARIADQTNLLALNAAIEAARAGQHGKGFAVVADEVRTLAETSEKSAKEIQDLVGQIQQEVQMIAKGILESAQRVAQEVVNGALITEQLEQIRVDFIEIVGAIGEIATGADQSRVATAQAMKGSEDIAAAAEQQSAAAAEAASTIAQQAQALVQSEQAAANLSELTEDLKNSTDVTKSAEGLASAAEELSAAVQEISRSGSQIMAAVEQIRNGAQVQSSGSEQASAAVIQIERAAQISVERGTASSEKVASITSLLGVNKQSVDSMIANVSVSVDGTRVIIRQVKELELVSRRIDKIVDAITTVSIQTNMLAVNGSIEAARAGEFGKGFVVVATDIRNLAQDSAENADRIKDLVKAVQDQIALVSRDLDEIVAIAISEVEKAKATSQALVNVEADIGVVERGTTEILAAGNEIENAIGAVKRGIEQITSAAQEALKASDEAAAAARQQSQGTEELAAAIEEISSLADELQSA